MHLSTGMIVTDLRQSESVAPDDQPPDIENGTEVTSIRHKGEHLVFDRATLESIGGADSADYRLSIEPGSAGTSDFLDVQRSEPKFEAEITTEYGETYRCDIVLGRIPCGASIEAHAEICRDTGGEPDMRNIYRCETCGSGWQIDGAADSYRVTECYGCSTRLECLPPDDEEWSAPEVNAVERAGGGHDFPDAHL